MVQSQYLCVGSVLFLSTCLSLCQRGAFQNVPPPGNPLGMESGAILDSSLTASSEWDPNHGPHRARLNLSGGGGQIGAWAAAENVTQNQWIQVDLLTMYRITGVATQGRQDYDDQWITSFKVACSVDGVAFENVKDIPNQPEADKIFAGNTDRNTVVYNTLPMAKACRYVRLLPVTWNKWVSLRMELYGEGPIPGLNVTLLYGDATGEGFVLKDEGSRKGFVCASSWNLQSAEVACRMLGFIGVESFTQRLIPFIPFDPDSIPVLRDGYTCNGRETTLLECTPVRHNSSCDKAAGVVCTNTTVRLSGSDLHDNRRVEIYIDTFGWGSVCGEGWDNQDGQVICRMLGYPDIATHSVGPVPGNAAPITINSLNCIGNEINIDDCTYNSGRNIACPVNQVASLHCADAVRLVNGPCDSEGRVEVYKEGSWGAVCDDDFTTEDATIVCKMLALDFVELSNWEIPPSAESARGAKLKNPWCSGNETDIRYCMHGRNSPCNTYAALRCSDPLSACPAEFSSYEVYWSSSVDTDTTTRQPLQETSTMAEITTARQTTGKGTTTAAVSTMFGQETTLRPTTARPTTVGHTTTVGRSTTVRPTTVTQRTTARLTSASQTTVILTTTATRPTAIKHTTTISAYTQGIVTTQSPIKGAIDEILNENITADNLDTVSVELENVTKEYDKFDENDLQSVTEKLSSVIGFASEQNLTKEAVVQVSESVIGAVDNILNIPESTFQTTDSRQVSRNILTTISTLTEAIQNTSTSNFTYSGSNIKLAAVKVDRRKFPLRTAIGGAKDDVIDFAANEAAPSNMAGVTSVSLPEAILPSVPSTKEAISVSVFLVNSPKLFQKDKSSPSSTPSSGSKRNRQPKTTSVVASPILSVTVEGADIKDLPENESIVFVFPVNQSLIPEESVGEVTHRCVYWDIGLGEWSDEGCKTEKAALEGLVSCKCNHLTSFAVLLDIKGSIISKALDVVSRVGCIASIICLVLTLIILLGFRKLRIKQPQQILINLSFALLALYVTFVIGIDRPTWGIGCTVFAILLHYFCLTSVAWMGIEAFSMYMMFVRVMNTYISKFLLKCSLVGWGIPLVVVIVTVASKWTAFQNDQYCFVIPGYSLYFGLILPIGLILIFNGIIFTMVLYKLTCGRTTFSKPSTWESKKESMAKAREEAIRRAQNAVAIGTLLGLTWAFGFMSFGGGRYLFNALFAIFNSLQGVFVFLLFGIRQPEVREKLRATQIRLLHGVSHARRRSSDFWVSSSGTETARRSSGVTFISANKVTSFAEGQLSTCSEITRDADLPVNKESSDTLL